MEILMTSTIAIARMYAMASAFGHGWAVRVSRVVLNAAVEAIASHGAYRVGGNHPADSLTGAHEALECLFTEEPGDDTAVPQTEAECGAMYALHLASCSEPWQAGLAPSWTHTTGTGRVHWDVCPETGRVVIETRRPGEVVVLRAVVDPRGRLTWRAPGAYYVRHVDALGEALKALGITLPVEVWLGISDEVETLRAQAAELQSDVLRARKMDNDPYEEALQLGLARNRVFRLLAGDPEFFPAVPMGTRITAAEAVNRARALRLETARTLVTA